MLKKKFSILLLFFIIASPSCTETGIGDELSPDLAAKSFYMNPDRKIREIEKNSKNYQKNFILAKAFKHKKELKNAILYFANSCFKKNYNFNLRLFADPVYVFTEPDKDRSIFYNESIYEIASIFYDYNENEYVIKFTELIKEDDSALYRDSVLLRSKSREKMNQYRKAIDELNTLSSRFTDSDSLSQVYIRTAAVYESAGDFSKASELYLKVIKSSNSTWENTIAAKRLTYCIREKGIRLDSPEKLLYFGEALYDAGEYEKAFSVIESIPQKARNYNSELIKIKILTRKYYPKSLEFLKQKINNPDYEKLLLEHAGILWDSGKKSIAVKSYEQLAYSSDDNLSERVLTRLAFYFEERNKPELLKYMESYVKKFHGASQSGRFIWLMGRHHMKKGNKDKAAEYFNRGIKEYPLSSYTSYCRFWLNKINSAGAVTISDEILRDLAADNPDTYHAITLLKQKASKTDLSELTVQYEAARKNKNNRKMLLFHTLLFMKTGYDESSENRIRKLDSRITEPYRNLAALIKNPEYKSRYKTLLDQIENYFLTGDIDSVNREIKLIPEKDNQAQVDLALAMTILSSKYGYYNYSSFYGFRLLALLKIKENLSLLPRSFARLLYPDAFQQCVNDESTRYKINRELLLSMMKVESNFKYNAVSPAGAIGLMQLMPVTARGIAKELKMKVFDIHDPCTSIKFGAHYIAWLNRYYKGCIEYMVSGYNAGARNVDRWKRREINKDMDYFSEYNPFYETRDYIFRTKKYMIQYELIYKNNK